MKKLLFCLLAILLLAPQAFGACSDLAGPYTAATLPAASSYSNCVTMITDGANLTGCHTGRAITMSNGTSWICSDRGGDWEIDDVSVGDGTETRNVVSGFGMSPTLVDAGAQINFTLAVNTATVLSRATHQAGTDLYLDSNDGSDTYTATLNPTLTTYTTGQCFILDVATNNTGAATLNIDSQGAAPIKILSSGALADPGNDVLDVQGLYEVCYDGTNFVLEGQEGGGGSETSPQIASHYYPTVSCSNTSSYPGSNWRAGSAAKTCLQGTGTYYIGYYAFDPTSEEDAHIHLRLPSNIDLTENIDVDLHWAPATGASEADVVAWGLDSGCIDDGEDFKGLPGTFTADADSTTALVATPAHKRHTTSFTGIPTTGCTAEDTLIMKVSRTDLAGADTMDGEDALLQGLNIEWAVTPTAP